MFFMASIFSWRRLLATARPLEKWTDLETPRKAPTNPRTPMARMVKDISSFTSVRPRGGRLCRSGIGKRPFVDAPGRDMGSPSYNDVGWRPRFQRYFCQFFKYARRAH